MTEGKMAIMTAMKDLAEGINKINRKFYTRYFTPCKLSYREPNYFTSTTYYVGDTLIPNNKIKVVRLKYPNGNEEQRDVSHKSNKVFHPNLGCFTIHNINIDFIYTNENLGDRVVTYTLADLIDRGIEITIVE